MALTKNQQLAIATRGYLGGGDVVRLAETITASISVDTLTATIELVELTTSP